MQTPKVFCLSVASALVLLALARPALGVSIPTASDTSTTAKNTITVAGGKAATLTVSPTQDALVQFDLSQLPANYSASNIGSARLRIYVSRLTKPGDLSVHFVTQASSEAVAGPAPAFDPTPIALVSQDKLGTKRFVIVDVTATVQGWLTNPASNFGFAISAAGATPTLKALLGSKEGPAVGFPAELEVELGAGGGGNNQGTSSFIGGGNDNFINAGASFATIPGGLSNEIGANGSFSLAAGRRAVANHAGSFVWADSTNADFSSTADNQFSIRAANGVFIANDAGNGTTAPIGTRFRDNSVVAWGRVTATGTLDSNFNVATITKVGTGHYKVNLNAPLQSGFSLIPIVTPEVDEAAGNVPPVGAANLRFAVTNQFASGTNFDVYIYNGSFASVDNDFQFIVTGR
jgi:hypothetical protein